MSPAMPEISERKSPVVEYWEKKAGQSSIAGVGERNSVITTTENMDMVEHSVQNDIPNFVLSDYLTGRVPKPPLMDLALSQRNSVAAAPKRSEMMPVRMRSLPETTVQQSKNTEAIKEASSGVSSQWQLILNRLPMASASLIFALCDVLLFRFLRRKKLVKPEQWTIIEPRFAIGAPFLRFALTLVASLLFTIVANLVFLSIKVVIWLSLNRLPQK